jgi:hypothetical protein
MDPINTFTVSSEIQTNCESSVDAWSKEARWNSLLPSNSLLQTAQRCSLYNFAICCGYQLEQLYIVEIDSNENYSLKITGNNIPVKEKFLLCWFRQLTDNQIFEL